MGGNAPPTSTTREEPVKEEILLQDHENPAKTSTPSKHHQPLVWYLKWASSIVLILAMLATANNLFPLNLFIHFVGIAGWLGVSILWNDRALIVVNSVALVIFANGILGWFLKNFNF
jgi:hypothetical protein